MWIVIALLALPLVVLGLLVLSNVADDVSDLKKDLGLDAARRDRWDDDPDGTEPAAGSRMRSGNFVIRNQWLEGGRYGHDGKYDDNYDRGYDTDDYPI